MAETFAEIRNDLAEAACEPGIAGTPYAEIAETLANAFAESTAR
jgi:hypothetical protein